MKWHKVNRLLIESGWYRIQKIPYRYTEYWLWEGRKVLGKYGTAEEAKREAAKRDAGR